MPPRGFTNDDANGKEFTIKKYQRQRTLIKKMLELSNGSKLIRLYIIQDSIGWKRFGPMKISR